MRISDWSSDVCSSDLSPGPGEGCLLHSSPEFFRSDPMLDANLKTQLQAYLEKVTRPIEIVASVDDGETSKEMLELPEELDAMSDKIALLTHRDDDQRKPPFALTPPAQPPPLRPTAIPMRP